MNNFAEELTYWYFRLNGFFLLQNYVLHNIGQGEQRGTADCDLLAIRFPYVYEKVGGQNKDWDKEKFSTWGFDIDRDNLALIIEVKSGRELKKNKIEKSFSPERVKTALYRFGIFSHKDVHRIHENLLKQKYVKESSWTIAKVLVTEKAKEIEGNWLNLSLDEIDKFIHKRIKSYLHDKYADRMYFPSILIQYIAWKDKNRILNDC
ncbi:hypothetical protein M2349_001704 [Caldanaerobacter subterraneus subsp. tengcongensis MB4]|jgi:hypothetical protein|uniref:Uncharacterized protein n=2 Tax=Caldanaerobacter subterraneus TaxID=911092 RepID=Q8RBZ1_CALS4|nr:hypothetical protein [Caldanaerobacter subterraneus]AAM23929.1 hypothetical protein TTE0663 [Caldanaerobacter subterraneus subsp. tengcongensis MB4]ERM92685.1 hypothetical protein O163_03660 [Caldanaerobacter subterraneus subsp. yonseiensis KB-1]MCS3916563.1 hypothetical protein [Caldanaerobacter subterraneus subsp. tengcongensis MB4]